MKDRNLRVHLPAKLGPNGDLEDPSILNVGKSFVANWAFIDEHPAQYMYEVYDRHMRAVYVGITDWFPSRWSAHLRASWWATSVDISCVILSGFRSRFEARLAEALFIAEHRPPCNIKPELKYLRIARSRERPNDVMTAELLPTRKF